MPGVFIVRRVIPTGIAVDDLATIVGASEADDWANLVLYLPLR
jgi:hypothetical protein